MEDREGREDSKEFFEHRIARLERRAAAHARLGEYPRSIELLEEACRLSRRWLGGRPPSAAPRHMLLAEQYRRIGEGGKAERHIRRLAALEGSAEDFDAMSYARTLNALGVLRCELGHHQGALQPFAQALEIARRDPGEASPAVAVLAVNLARAHHVLGHHRQAEALYLEALGALGRCAEPKVLDTVYCLCSLAELQILEGRRESAFELADRAFAATFRPSDTDPEELAEGLARLADLYYRLGEAGRALELVRESARKLEEAGGSPVTELHRCLDRLERLENQARSWTGAGNPSPRPQERRRPMTSVHALVIGIDHYTPSDLYADLKGAVADAEAVRAVLAASGVPEDRIQLLTARSPDPQAGRQEAEGSVTYEDLVNAFRAVKDRAEPGSHVFIHYSGHGGRTDTLIPNSKGSKGKDEGLVPSNISDPGARYLRDVELAYLLAEMTEKGLRVTLVIDACHSGGALREGARLVRRGGRSEDCRPVSGDSSVAGVEELERTWRSLARRSYSSLRGESSSGWAAAMEGLVLLAACRADDPAYESLIEGRFRGVLTYNLLGILSELGVEVSWQQVFDRLVARVHQHASYQTPVLEGEDGRSVLGEGFDRPMDGVSVLEVDATGRRVLLRVGQAMGIEAGALFRLRPSAAPPSAGSEALAEIVEAGATYSWAQLEPSPSYEIQPGDRAVLLDPGQTFRHRVAWLPEATAALPSPLAKPDPGRAEERFLEAAADGENADFLVGLDGDGNLEILSSDGFPVPDAPSLPLDKDDSHEKVLETLRRLARFSNARNLENRDESSPKGALSVKLSLLPDSYQYLQEIRSEMLDPLPPVPKVELGRWICLTIENLEREALHLYVLDLQPGWGIEVIYPQDQVDLLEKNRAVHLPLKIYLPAGLEGRRNILKVFGTRYPTDFRFLSQPSLDKRRGAFRSSLGRPRSALERLFAEIAQDGPKTRHGSTHSTGSEWTSAQVEFEIVTSG